MGVAVGVLLIIPVTSEAAFDVSLKYGAKGSAVIELQEFLTSQGVYTGPITGNFYSLTLQGVKAFQTANLLPSTGYFGPMSRAKANDLIAADLSSSDQEEVQEFGSVSAPTNTDAIDALYAQISALSQKIAELNTITTEQNTQIQQQTNQIQQQTTTIQETQSTLQQIQENTAPEPTPEPVIVPPKPTLSNVSVGFYLEPGADIVANSLSFQSDQDVLCHNLYTKNCVITGENAEAKLRTHFGSCNAPLITGYYLFQRNQTYTCVIHTQNSNGEASIQYSFTVPL